MKKDYLSWDEYFMGLALLSSKRSKDPNTQVGCCIANKDNVIVAIGYNGLPRGCRDQDYPWERTGSFKEVKYSYVVHAELNAILNSKIEYLDDCKLYVTLFPCNECAKAIIQKGIKQVYFLSDKYHDSDVSSVSRRLFDDAGVKYKQLDLGKKQIIIDFDKDNV